MNKNNILSILWKYYNEGPTIVISPLLSLMNNQLESAAKFNLIDDSNSFSDL